MTPEDKAPDMPCCAHLRVTERHEENGGFVTRTWWECELCRLEFTPLPPQSPDQGAAEALLADKDRQIASLTGQLGIARAAAERALTRPPLDLDKAMRIVWDAGYKIHGSFGWVQDDHLQAIRPDLFGGKE